MIIELPTMIPHFNPATLPYPVSVQESEVSLQRTAREVGPQPETRRGKNKKENQRKKNRKNQGRNLKYKDNKR